MNVVNEYGENRNGFTEVVAFCHVTCRYFDRFLLQGVDRNWRQACIFYLAPGLICEVYWQVNSRRSIFRIADPIFIGLLTHKSQILMLYMQRIDGSVASSYSYSLVYLTRKTTQQSTAYFQ